ncbi:MAG: flagellar basal body P-ring formation chaperone FlgA [Alphaproteobacteria bacterium]|nr:flagellar basal body P-ring formation chaperone FlgA [Rhodospirillales bacterium]MCW9046366.1 flagellar basal body P-ring formation chaperone FlgA [Alphaproteobacteria bacterium]
MRYLTKTLSFGLVGLVMTLASVAQVNSAVLNERIKVTDKYILLGDLFDNAGEKADKAVAYSPRPGKSTVFEARWLYKVARSYKLEWRPEDINVRAVVVRDSNVIYRAQVEEELLNAILEQGAPKSSVVQINNRTLKIHVNADQAPSVEVEEIQYDKKSRRFTAIIAAPAGDPSAQRFRVSGRTHAVQEIPVPAHRIRKGEIISENDIQWIKVRLDRLDSNTVVSLDQVLGMTPKRALREGVSFRVRDVQRPIAVTKRSLVTLILQTPLMTMTAKGKSLDNGAKGETIRVVNTKSKAIVEAVVIGPGQASVTSNSATNSAKIRRLAMN